MDIDVKILGPGCKNCLEAVNIVRMMAKEHGLPVQIEKIGNTDRCSAACMALSRAAFSLAMDWTKAV